MGLFENATQDLNYKSTEIDTSNLTSTQFVNSNSIRSSSTDIEEVELYVGDKTSWNATDTLTDEELEWFIGKMSDQEYDSFVKEIEEYYGKSIESYEQLLENANAVLTELNDQEVVDACSGYAISKDFEDQQLYSILQEYVRSGKCELSDTELTNMVKDKEKWQKYIIEHSEEAKQISEEYAEIYKNHEEYLKKLPKEYGITSFEQYLEYKKNILSTIDNINEAIKTTKNMKDSVYYDNLKYLSDYNNFKEHELTDAERDYIKKKTNINPTMNNTYDYNDFHRNFPDTTPLDFIKLLQEVHPYGNYMVTGIKDLQNLNTIANACDKIPDLSKTYAYLYNQDPKKAEEYMKDTQYELNNIEGQLRAERFLSNLGVADGNNDVLETVANELGVSVEGLVDGLETFGSGIGYSFEALLTALGITEENRTMSAEEYKKMYILYGLLDEESKIKTGLLTKNDNGQLENTNPNSIIDYTKTYSGGITLKWNYEISQGIGNMIPSIAISYACPIAGSIAMGVSAGGNAYHDAMVNGDSLFSSIMYGVFTGTSEAITERILGGLPGLSDVQVTSLATYAKACVSEGFQESFQGVMDAVYRASFMGEELPTTAEGWAEFGKDILKQGVYGAVTAGIMQAPALSTSLYGKFKFNKSLEANNITKQEQAQAIKALKDADTTGKLKKMSNNEIILTYGDLIIETILNNKAAQTNGYSDTSLLGYDGDITEELDITQELDVTAELPEVQYDNSNEDSSYTSDPIIRSNPDFNAMEMKNEINSKVTSNMNEVQKARTLYMELNKRISYDLNYNVGDINTKEKIYNTEVSFENLQDSSVVCKGWSELYRELLIENGFDANNVRLVGESQTGARSHIWVEITLSDGNIIIADATDNINHSIDLANCKIGLATNGFVYTRAEDSGMRLNSIKAQDMVNFGRTQWQGVDSELGYNNAGLYYDEIVTQAQTLFGKKKFKRQSFNEKVDSMLNVDFPTDLDGYDSYVYYNTIKRILFNGTDQQNIRINVAANYTGTQYEGITMVSAQLSDGSAVYAVYSKSTGKHIFTNLTDYSNYLNSLKIKNLK